MWGSDVRAAWRRLARSPVITGVVVATLSAGIGAASAAFSIVDAVLFRPPAGVTEANELVAIYSDDLRTPASEFASVAYPDYVDFAEQEDFLAGLAAYARLPATVVAEGRAERVVVELTSSNYFATLGVRARLGRLFGPGDAAPSDQEVGIISHRLWMEAYDGDLDVVGKRLIVNRRSLTIVGVAPTEFRGVLLDWYGGEVDVYVVLEKWIGSFFPFDVTRVRAPWHMAVGRLRRGRDVQQLQVALDLRAARLAVAFPDTNGDRGVAVVPVQRARFWPGRRPDAIRFLGLLLAGACMVMGVACANTAALMLGRAIAAEHEATIRLALGAGGGVIIRQSLVEALLLFLGGAAGGIALARAGPAVVAAFPQMLDVAMYVDPRVDMRVVGVAVLGALGGALVAGCAAGVLALRLLGRGRLVGGRPYGAVATNSSSGTKTLVVVQVALSVSVVLAAVLLLRSLHNLRTVERGFSTDGILLVDIAVPVDLAFEVHESTVNARYHRILEVITDLPAVVSAAYGPPPPSREFRPRAIDVSGARSSELTLSVRWAQVGAGYFRTLQIPLLGGREFMERDRDYRFGAIINASMGQRLGGEHLIGRRVTLDGETEPREVVGVVADLRQGNLRSMPEPYVYIPMFGRPHPEATLIVRTRDAPVNWLDRVRDAIQATDPLIPIVRIRTMEDHLGEHLSRPRLAAVAVGALGGVALLLVSVGLFGLVSLTVTRRIGEIGIRVALGATPRAVAWMIWVDAVRVLMPGLVLGSLGSLLVLRGIRSEFYGVALVDPLAWCIVILLLLFVTVAACVVPVTRALALDPVAVLKSG